MYASEKNKKGIKIRFKNNPKHQDPSHVFNVISSFTLYSGGNIDILYIGLLSNYLICFISPGNGNKADNSNSSTDV